MISCILIFSFLFESIFTNLVSINSIFIPLFTLTSLVLVYPYFNKKNINYIIVCLIIGFFYDISFADSIFINTICFGIIGSFTMICYNYIKYNAYTANIVNLIMIVSYRIISYIILLAINYITFNNRVLFLGIFKSIMINIPYCFLVYFALNFFEKKFNIKR